MIAYKFLRAGRIGPFSGFQWPEPGVWVRAAPRLAIVPTRHSCLPAQRPSVVARRRAVGDRARRRGPGRRAQDHRSGRRACARGSRRGRPACAQEYADACAWRARDRAVEALTHAGHGARHASSQRARHSTTLLVAARQLADDIPRHAHQPHDRRRRCRPRTDRRAADERIHRRARRPATRRTRRLRRRASLAVAVARRAARAARRQ